MTDSFAKIWIAVALLCAAACGAFTAWRMSVIDDSMGDALNDATHALITDSSARIRAANDVSDHLRAYADYVAASNSRDISLINPTKVPMTPPKNCSCNRAKSMRFL